MFWILDISTLELENRTEILLWSITDEGERIVLVDSYDPYLIAVSKDDLKPDSVLGKIYQVEGPEEMRIFSEAVRGYRVRVPKVSEIDKISRRLSRAGFEVYEDDVRPSITYFHERAILPSSWVEAQVGGEVDLEGIPLKALRLKSIEPAEGDPPDLRILGMHAIVPTYGPTPSPGKDRLFSVALKSSDGREFYLSGEEREVLEGLVGAVREVDPDVIVSWKSNYGIIPFLLGRAKELGVELRIGREETEPHQSLFGHFSVAGRINLDAFDFARDDPNIKLKTLESALEWYGIRPEGMVDEVELPRLVEEDREAVRKHAMGIAESMLRLWDLFGPYLIEVSRISGYPMDYAIVASPGFRVEGYLMKNARRLGQIVPKRPKGFAPETYPGGMVLEPKAGIHENVAVLDFASMYPHIILKYNLSPDTLDPECREGSYKAPQHGHCFLKEPDGLYRVSVGDLIEARKAIKAEKAKVERGGPRYRVLDAQEKAIKVMTNAIYGYAGWAGARWYRREVAESITSWGRNLLKRALEIAKEEGLTILYGDSTSGDTKVYVKGLGEVRIADLFQRVDAVSGDKEYHFPEDLYVLTMDLNTGKVGYGKVKYVMRHKTNKKMYRIWLNNTTYVDVTEDHSLIGYVNKLKRHKFGSRFIKVRPTDIGRDIKSLIMVKKIPRNKVISRNYPKEVYEFLGFYLGDGSRAGRVKLRDKGLTYYYFDIGAGLDVEDVVKLLETLKAKGWIRGYSFSKSRNGDIKFWGGRIISIIPELYDGDKKIVPKFMFYETEENIKAFIRGLFSADGTIILRKNSPIIRLSTIDKKLAFDVSKLLHFIGIANSVFRGNTVNTFEADGRKYGGKTYSYYVNVKGWREFANIGFIVKRKQERLSKCIEQFQVKRSFYKEQNNFTLIRVVKIEEIEYDNYVYDLEVEGTHTFFGNDILLHNTDSLFVTNDEEKVEKVLRRIREELGFEIKIDKVYRRVMFTEAKKRYVGLMEDGRIDIVGLEAARGDWCRAARELQKEVAAILLKEGDREKAISAVHKRIRELRAGKVPIKDLIIWKTLSRPLKAYKVRPPHVELAMRIEERGYRLKAGDQIGFVVIKGAGRLREKVKLYYEASPEEIDREYYVRNQLVPAAHRLLSVLGVPESALIPKEGVTSLFEF